MEEFTREVAGLDEEELFQGGRTKEKQSKETKESRQAER